MPVAISPGILFIAMFIAAIAFAVLYDFSSYPSPSSVKTEDEAQDHTIDGAIDETLFTILLLFVLIMMFGLLLPMTLGKMLCIAVLTVYLGRLVYAFRSAQKEARVRQGTGQNIGQD
ncbi:MAG: hypothetical protein ACYCX4_15055 [Bacillota bacterium]